MYLLRVIEERYLPQKKNWLLSCVIKIIQSLGEENVSATLPILRCCFGWFDGPESPQAQYLVCDDFKLEGCLILPPCSYMFSKQKPAVYSNWWALQLHMFLLWDQSVKNLISLLFSFVDYVPVKGEIIWYLSLTTWLISLGIMLSSSIHAVAKGISLFFLCCIEFHCVNIP